MRGVGKKEGVDGALSVGWTTVSSEKGPEAAMANKDDNLRYVGVRAHEAAAVLSAGLLLAALKASGGLSRGLVAGALAVLLLSLFTARPFEPLARLWYGLGDVLGRVITPIVLSVLFFFVLTPVALLHRMVRRDPLRLKRQAGSLFAVRERAFGREDLLRPF